jgi:type II secretory ATPase GspE/PulE/Tfp pilus assembly ATPase PilB-like protein
MNFSSLGLNEREVAIFSAALRQERGAILLSGPTGSGKSTLLHMALRELAAESKNIVTIEDPVERLIAGVTQIPVDRARGLDFHNLFENVLRQDPDVVMMGEIRDIQTANIALTASITGHLLLSTVHAGNALEVIVRLQGLGVSCDLISSALKLIVSQRLIPLVCKICATKERAPLAACRFFRFGDDQTLVRAKGCSECSDTGVNGRVGVFEMLPITPSLRGVLSGSLKAFGEAAFKEGYQPLGVRVRELLMSGEISLDAATRVLGVDL